LRATVALGQQIGDVALLAPHDAKNGQGSGVVIDPRSKNVHTVFDKQGRAIKTPTAPAV